MTNLAQIVPQRADFDTDQVACWNDGFPQIGVAGGGGSEAAPANVGNGTLTVSSVAGGARRGVYLRSVIATAGGLARYSVTDLDGDIIGTGVSGLPVDAGGLAQPPRSHAVLRVPMLCRLTALALLSAALANPARALDAIQSTTVPGRAPPTGFCSTSPAAIAVNRADGTISFCSPSGVLSTRTLIDPANAALGNLTVASTITSIQPGIPTNLSIFPAFGGLYRFALRNNNGIVAMVQNNAPPTVPAYPTAVTGYGRLDSKSNTVFGVFGRADAYTEGVATNEFDSFNFKGDAPNIYPFWRGFGPSGTDGSGNPVYVTAPVALTLAAGGEYRSAAAIDISGEGVTPNGFQFGIGIRKDAVHVAGLVMDADTTSGVPTNLLLRNTGQGSNIILDMQTTGTAVASNPIVRHRDAAGTETYRVNQSGFVYAKGGSESTGFLARSSNYPYQRFLNDAAPADNRLWEWSAYPDGTLHLRTANDAFSAGNDVLTVARSSAAVTSITAGAPVKLRAYTVSTLPGCNAAMQDAMAVVTDAATPTYRGALTGGGAVRTPVYCDGTTWTAH